MQKLVKRHRVCDWGNCVAGRPAGETLDQGESSPIEWRAGAASCSGGRVRADGNGGGACRFCPTHTTHNNQDCS